MKYFAKSFCKDEVKSWLEANGQYVRLTKNVVSNFPEFKERSRFKGLVKAATEENEVRTFMTL